jgi:galactose-1-phosphate uridylyltransferase
VFEKQNIEGKQVLPIQLRAGFYVAHLKTEKGISVVKVVVELHDQQLDDCTVKEMEQALFIVDEVIRMKKARAIVPQSQQAA